MDKDLPSLSHAISAGDGLVLGHRTVLAGATSKRSIHAGWQAVDSGVAARAGAEGPAGKEEQKCGG